MDLQEWELLSDDGFLDFHENSDDNDQKKVSPISNRSNSSRTGFDLYSFRCSQQSSPTQQFIPMPIQLNPSIGMPPDDEVTKLPILETVKNRSLSLEDVTTEADQDAVSKVFFKKLKGNEFVDMKLLDSPKSPTRGILPQIDSGFQFEEKPEFMENTNSPRRKTNEDCEIKEEANNWEKNNDGTMNMWKWSMTGIGAICSFGVAAATVCMFVFGSQQRSKQQQQQQQNQKLRYQIYADEKRISQVVEHANKLNDVISAARGAHITVGGYFNTL